jgi:Ni,Fe-hydrogenase I cytochrome b subunit
MSTNPHIQQVHNPISSFENFGIFQLTIGATFSGF